MPIGDYATRMIIERRTATPDPAYGQADESYSDAGEVWAAIDETAAGKRRAFNQVEVRTDATIRVHGTFAGVTARDRLRVKSTGEVYRLSGVRLGVGELICEAFLLPLGG